MPRRTSPQRSDAKDGTPSYSKQYVAARIEQKRRERKRKSAGLTSTISQTRLMRGVRPSS